MVKGPVVCRWHHKHKKVSLAVRNTQACPETPRLTGRKNLEIGIQSKLED